MKTSNKTLVPDSSDHMQLIQPEHSEKMLSLGRNIGQLEMLKNLEPALSDGLRKGSPECARIISQLPKVRIELQQSVAADLRELGVELFEKPEMIENKTI